MRWKQAITILCVIKIKKVLHTSFNKARENREAIAIEAPRLCIADLLAMVDVGSGETASGQDAAPASGQEAREENNSLLVTSSDDEEDLSDEDEATRLSDVFSSGVGAQGKTKGQPLAKTKSTQAKGLPAQKARPQATVTASGQDGPQSASHTPLVHHSLMQGRNHSLESRPLARMEDQLSNSMAAGRG